MSVPTTVITSGSRGPRQVQYNGGWPDGIVFGFLAHDSSMVVVVVVASSSSASTKAVVVGQQMAMVRELEERESVSVQAVR